MSTYIRQMTVITALNNKPNAGCNNPGKKLTINPPPLIAKKTEKLLTSFALD